MQDIRLNNVEKNLMMKAVKFFSDKRISFDIDDVEIFTSKSSIALFNKRYGKHFKKDKTVDDVNSFFIMPKWLEEIGVEDPVKNASAIWHDEAVLLRSDPIPGMLTFNQLLSEYNNTPHRITSRPGMVRDLTLKWYKKWHAALNDKFIRIQNNSPNIDPEFKANEIKRLGIEYHFEDSWEHAENIVSKTNATVVLVPQPWNRYYAPKSNRIIVSEDKSQSFKIVRTIKALVETLDL